MLILILLIILLLCNSNNNNSNTTNTTNNFSLYSVQKKLSSRLGGHLGAQVPFSLVDSQE